MNKTIQRKVVLRSFLSGFIVLLFVFILLTTFAFYSAKSAVLSNIESANIALTQRANDLTEQFYEMVRSYASNIFDSGNIVRLRQQAGLTGAETEGYLREVCTFASSADFIHSIYIYNGKEQEIYSTFVPPDRNQEDTSCDVSAFFDSGAAELFLSGKASSPVYRRFPYGGHDRYVVSFFCFERDPETGEAQNGIALNVSTHWLRRFLRSLYVMEDTGLFLEDGTGLILSDDFPLSGGEAASLIADTLSRKTASSSVRTINGTRYICFCTKSSRFNSFFIRALPFRTCLKDAIVFRRIMILFIAVFTLTGIAGCVYISRRSYLPARKLLGILSPEVADASPLSSLDEVVDLAAGELKNYQKLMKEETLRQYLFFPPGAEPTGQELERRNMPRFFN